MAAPKGYFRGYYGGNLKNEQPKFKATGEYRAPLKGEYYLSGAIVEAYRAPNDLSYAYWIAIPVEMKKCPRCNGTGEVEK